MFHLDFRAGDEGGIAIEADSSEETAEENTVAISETFVVQESSPAKEAVQCRNITSMIEAKEPVKHTNNESENIPVNTNNEKTADPVSEPAKPARKIPSNICASTEEWRQRTKNTRRIGGHSQPLKAVHPVETMQVVKPGQCQEKQTAKQISNTDQKKKDRRYYIYITITNCA